MWIVAVYREQWAKWYLYQDYVYSFDKSGIFYNIYDGEEYERGVFHANDRDLYINIGSSLIHWEIQSCKDSELMLYSTRSGYTPGICKLVRLWAKDKRDGKLVLNLDTWRYLRKTELTTR